MTENVLYDLCIVGAGMFGSAAARHASSNSDLKVCLIGPNEPLNDDELKKREIFGCHYDEGRITRILDDEPCCQILSKHAINRYKDLEHLSGIKFHDPVGCLFMGYKNDPYLQKVLKGSQENVPMIDLSCEETFKRRYPFICKKTDEVAYFDDNNAGHISPRKMVDAQKKIANSQGCAIYDAVVSEIKQDENGVYKIEMEGNSDVILARKVLITTGSFINTKPFHVLKPLHVMKYKRTVALLKIPEEEVQRLSSMPSIIYRGLSENSESPNERQCYVLPPIKYPDGDYYLKIGCYVRDIEVETLDDMKEWYLSNGEKEIVDHATRMLLDLLPGLKYDSVSSDTCVTCYTRTNLPLLDNITPSLTVALGGNGKGAKFSDEIGRIAAHLAVTGSWISEIEKSRFKAIFREVGNT